MNSKIKIAFIDLEGTLISMGNWGKVANAFGAEEISKKFFKLYEEGKVGYDDWRRELEKVWRGKITKDQFAEILKGYEVFDGARELVKGLHDKGYKVIVITGGISVLAELVKEDLGIDEFYTAHEFIFDDKEYFIEIKEHPAYRRGEGKVEIIKEIIKKEKTDIQECIAVGGDDINDYWMMKELNSFSVNPHLRQIQEVVDHNINKLDEVLDFI